MLGLIVGAMDRAGHGSLGIDTFGFLPGMSWDAWMRSAIAALCLPHGQAPDVGAINAAQYALVLAMWCAMVLAMMLPTTSGMILTYVDIAETAARKDEPVISPMVLTAGYVAVWLGFAGAAAVMQLGLARLAPLFSSSLAFSGGLFIVAGLFQFSSFKHACLTQCQRPFPFLFANWSTRTIDIFRLGFRQGLYCLGCCWAMMLLMFAAGVMNVLWMAALGIVMGIEKMGTTKRFSHAVGALFLAIGAALTVSAIA
jgi:predicted metal-binding membrane protein